jgi:hypothetical protein
LIAASRATSAPPLVLIRMACRSPICSINPATSYADLHQFGPHFHPVDPPVPQNLKQQHGSIAHNIPAPG